jgi:class 3 adenylate cyclase
VPDDYVKLLRDQGKVEFQCPCGAVVSLVDPKERIFLRSNVDSMTRSADRQRDFDAFLVSAKGETSTVAFLEWAAMSRFENVITRWKTIAANEGLKAPSCFISYAWGNPEQEEWVEKSLASDLELAGINVVLDRWHNKRVGSSVPRFVASVAKCDYVVAVGTPLYRTKYDNEDPMRPFVVAAEGDLIGKRMIGTERGKESVFPALLEGTEETAFPDLLQGRVYADFRKAECYDSALFGLVLDLYRCPERHAAAEDLRRKLNDPVKMTVVFTDIVTSAALIERGSGEVVNEIRRAHFAQARKLVDRFEGREVKTIGERFMAAFTEVDGPLDYAIELQRNTGHPYVATRTAIHSGPVHSGPDDPFGGTVTFAAQMVDLIPGPEIWLSDRAKTDLESTGSPEHRKQIWERHEGVSLTGVPGPLTIWSLWK